MMLYATKGYKVIVEWLSSKGRQPFLFQEQSWQHVINGESGLVNAPTGCGKTYSVFLGAVIDFINHHPDDYKKIKNNGLQLLWITPLRALAADIGAIVGPVKSDFGYHIIQVRGREDRELTEDQVNTAKDNEFKTWLDDLKTAKADQTKTFDTWANHVPTDPASPFGQAT